MKDALIRRVPADSQEALFQPARTCELVRDA